LPLVVSSNSTYCSLFCFSSRRRHTRFSRDWSSDVCSSDLGGLGAGEHRAGHGGLLPLQPNSGDRRQADDGADGAATDQPDAGRRSEERSVGTDGKVSVSASHDKNTIKELTARESSRWTVGR